MYIGGSMVSPVIGSVSAKVFSGDRNIYPAAAAVFVAAAGLWISGALQEQDALTDGKLS